MMIWGTLGKPIIAARVAERGPLTWLIRLTQLCLVARKRDVMKATSIADNGSASSATPVAAALATSGEEEKAQGRDAPENEGFCLWNARFAHL